MINIIATILASLPSILCRTHVPQIVYPRNLYPDCEPSWLEDVLFLKKRDDRVLPRRFLGGVGDVVGVISTGARLDCFDWAEVGLSVFAHVISDARRLFWLSAFVNFCCLSKSLSSRITSIRFALALFQRELVRDCWCMG